MSWREKMRVKLVVLVCLEESIPRQYLCLRMNNSLIYLHHEERRKPWIDSNWAQSIKTFTSELLDRSAIDKGRKGELFSQLILTLAHDIAIELNADITSFHVPTLTVGSFLQALFSRCHHKTLARIDTDILQAQMNFLLFSSTQEHLTAESFQKLCYILLRRSAALQLAPQPKTYDQLLPSYCGDSNDPFDISKVGAILVQVKYRNETSSPSSTLRESFIPSEQADIYPTRGHSVQKSFLHIIVDNSVTKLLFILLDLGRLAARRALLGSHIRKLPIQRSGRYKVFGYLDEANLHKYTRAFFNSVMPLGKGVDISYNHHKEQLYNILYHDQIR
jgi:hypothetical protein